MRKLQTKNAINSNQTIDFARIYNHKKHCNSVLKQQKQLKQNINHKTLTKNEEKKI